jgi:anti-anti-sigma factor
VAPFVCVVERSGRVRPRGELDLATVGTVQNALERLHEDGVDRIVLDLRDVSFMDSTGIRLLLTWWQRSNGDGFQLTVRQGPRSVQEVLRIAGLLDSLPFERTATDQPTGCTAKRIHTSVPRG